MNSDFRNNFRPLLEHENENSEMSDEEPRNSQDLSYVSVNVNEKQSQPVDRYHITYIVFYLIGMTTLLPWNFFITAEEVIFNLPVLEEYFKYFTLYCSIGNSSSEISQATIRTF